jgi:hypothetical protein
MKQATRVILLSLENVDEVLYATEQLRLRTPRHLFLGQHVKMLQCDIAVPDPVLADVGEF